MPQGYLGKVEELEGVEQQITSILYRFIDHRDAKPGARITRKDIEEALAYAKETMVDLLGFSTTTVWT